ncbi:MAG: hypothetical protein ACFFG0_33055 [Candidatus Thorarchaeota archaeon]
MILNKNFIEPMVPVGITGGTKDKSPFQCEQCHRRLRICKVIKKQINKLQKFAIYVHYCNKCKLTYYVFKVIKKRGLKYD